MATTETTNLFAAIGGYVLAQDPVEINRGRPTLRLKVRNTGDRPIQVGSHFHFFEVNRALEFERPKALGWRLDIPAGTAVRFEPGAEKEVTLVPYGGQRRAHGFNNLVEGSVTSARNIVLAYARAEQWGFRSSPPGGNLSKEE